MTRVASAASANMMPGVRAALSAAVPAIVYGLRMTIAVSAALYLAFWLQLENASWAGTSACIVCQPVLGASLRKGIFRLVGTVTGAVATVLLTAVFPQNRVGFLIGLTVWCAACSYVSTVLRNFAAYAAMLAGYTLVIIASSSIAAPDQVFLLALSRATEICLGIVCGMVVMSTTDFGASSKHLGQDLSRLITEVGAGVAALLKGGAAEDGRATEWRRGLLKRTAALDPLVDQAIGESPAVSDRRTTLDAGLHGLFLALAAWRSIDLHLARLEPDEAAREAATLRDALPPGLGDAMGDETGHNGRNAAADAEDQRQRWSAQARTLHDRTVETSAQRLGIDRLASLLDGLGRAANAVVLLGDSRRAVPLDAVPKTFLPDALPPLVNAGRTLLAVGAAVLFYIATSWEAGPTFITFVAVTVLLLGPRDEAALGAAFGFGLGTALTAVLAAVIKFVVLPNHEGFGSLALIIGLVLIPMAALSTHPRLNGTLGAATMNFIPLLAPSNAITYDTAAFYNNALAIVGGSIAGTVMLRLIPSTPTGIRTRRLVGLTLRDLRSLARRPHRWTSDGWRSRIFARLNALPQTSTTNDGARLLAALTVGLQILELDQNVRRSGSDQALLRRVRDDLATGRVEAARETLQTLKQAIGDWSPSEVPVETRLRLQVAARETSDLLKSYAPYFGATVG